MCILTVRLRVKSRGRYDVSRCRCGSSRVMAIKVSLGIYSDRV